VAIRGILENQDTVAIQVLVDQADTLDHLGTVGSPVHLDILGGVVTQEV